ncbi:hypothetical protein FHR24_003019 [Wenyingzhuangia heitensis]|uniref:DUF3853 family protein n=1 Tax=Wenyingzhuangia heitensis TaxID=1487859 RepID=A0ABX0UCG9_9FLAO|nr:DUF3853 family protein [Wenyingzhuangia heitensis]NIJ46530.1 hypothetical protein [Wenyingzhuangia heitensis]
MNVEVLKTKLLFQLTVEEFLFLLSIDNKTNEKIIETTPSTLNNKYVYGIRGIQNLLGCSRSTANRMKKSGIINDAIIQNSRKIIVNADMALELIKEHNKNNK